MSFSLDGNSSTLFKEVHIQKTVREWKKITLNTGGVASTLQDSKAPQRCGGYVFQEASNRFIYWRTSHNVLELVEESLNVNLLGNQIRYKFTDSPVLEGLSITETLNHIVVLVPTVSSLHKFTYPHPIKMARKDGSDSSALSIFHAVKETDVLDPSTFHALGANQGVVCAATCLAINGDAVFSLAMTNGSVEIVRMQSGSVATMTLSHDSLVPRFLSGLTEAIMKRDDHVSVSLVLHYIKRNLYLFSVDRRGCLKAWCCESGASVASIELGQKGSVGLKHRIMKGIMDNTFVLCVFLHRYRLFTINPVVDSGNFIFQVQSGYTVPLNLELIEMCCGERNDLWCCWLTHDEKTVVTRIDISSAGDWADVHLSLPPVEAKPNKYMPFDPAQFYLDAIFSCGYLTAQDVAQALSVYKTSAMIKPNADVITQIRSVVEAEIYTKVGEQDLDDQEFIDVSTGCWNRMYCCCSQYATTSCTPLGMLWLGSGSLALIQESGFSLVIKMDTLSLIWRSASLSHDYSKVSYAALLKMLREVDVQNCLDRLELAFHVGSFLDEDVLKEVASFSPPLFPKEALNDANKSLSQLMKQLMYPEDCQIEGPEWKIFCSRAGLSAITSAFRDFCSVRLEICKRLVLVLTSVNNESLRESFGKLALALCKVYYVLHWACTTNALNSPAIGTSVVYSFLVVQQGNVMQTTMEDTVMSLAHILWPGNGCEALAHHLFMSKEYVLLQELSRFVDAGSWRLLLAESYVKTGEYNKALDCCLNTCENNDVSYYLKVISLFEHCRSDLAIAVAKDAIGKISLSNSDRETFQSVLFHHELQLKHYEAAYELVQTCPVWSRRCDSLHRLVTTMVADGKYEELVNFSFANMIDEFDLFLTTRARALNFTQACTYYNLLYAFHVERGNFKKAASVMYEKGLRSDTAESQWRSFGASLSSLQLVDDDDAWIVRPKHSSDPVEESVEVLDVNEVRTEYELAGARYILGNCPPDASKEEVISACISAREYRIAARISKMCHVSCTSVVQNFTASVVSLSDATQDWQWLCCNEIDDIKVSEHNAEEMGWRILRKFIDKYESVSELHRAAANKIIEMGQFLPSWLVSSYLKKNAAELLRLYLSHGLLIEASELACDYLRAGMGVGYDAFNIGMPLVLDCPPIWIPINIIELLLKELREHKLEKELETTLNDFMALAKRISGEMYENKRRQPVF